ncbi:uncharacterized protein LOC135125911 isoform X2 [Zophobas morio]|uniref:uncharacterized protein LOC135125911 isoform X2 n=1 Tax=Zophobas morio TaxID=2755281 RepID=UPI003083BC1E
MLNRPFSSINTNIFDETTHNSSPATLCGQNVLVSQEQRQKVYNTLTTSIAGMPAYSGHYPPIQQNYPNQIMMQQNYPNPVTFTFNPNHSVLPQHNCWQCPPTMGTLNQLQQMNAIDMLALQGQLNEPYRCRFHLDNQTSTSDLSKENAKVEGNVYDDVDKQDEAKKVNFDLNTTKDAVCQAEFGCSCCQNQNNDPQPKPAKSSKRRRKSRKRGGNFSEESATEDDDHETDKL